jgi:hypothetical protein
LTRQVPVATGSFRASKIANLPINEHWHACKASESTSCAA